MKKTFVLLLLLMFSIASCARRFPTASDVQDTMESTVKVSVSIYGIKIYNDNGTIEKEKSEMGWSGSGVVVATDRSRGSGESLVMTARHVAQFDPEPQIMVGSHGFEVFLPKMMVMTVQKLDGSWCSAETIYSSLREDISVVKASCIAGRPADIAKNLQPVGAPVLISGAALGYHPNGVFVVVDGRFLGFEDGFEPQMVFSSPVAPGHSGSGVFYDGKLVGIVSRRVLDYEHISLAGRLEMVRDSMKKALEIWNAQIEEEEAQLAE